MTNAEQSKRDYPMIGRLMDAAQAANLSKDEFEVSAFALLALAISRLPLARLPMRMCNLALAEMTEALARGWGGRDSRSVMLLQQERAGVKIAVAPERLSEALAPTISGSR